MLVCYDDPEIAAKVRGTPSIRANKEIDRHVTKVIAVDLENAERARTLGQIKVDLVISAPDESAGDFADRIAARFKVHFPLFTKLVADGKKRVEEQGIVWSDHPIRTIDDLGELAWPVDPSCVVMTAADQRTEVGRPFLLLDRWLLQHPKGSALSRNTLFLHEYIYWMARERGHEDSAAVRESLRIALSQAPASMSDVDLKKLGLDLKSIRDQLLNFKFLVGTEFRDRVLPNRRISFIENVQMYPAFFRNGVPKSHAENVVESVVFDLKDMLYEEFLKDPYIVASIRETLAFLKAMPVKTEAFKDLERQKLDPVDGLCRDITNKESLGLDGYPVNFYFCYHLAIAGFHQYFPKSLFPNQTVYEDILEKRLKLWEKHMDVSQFIAGAPYRAVVRLKKTLDRREIHARLMKIPGATTADVENLMSVLTDELYLEGLNMAAPEALDSKFDADKTLSPKGLSGLVQQIMEEANWPFFHGALPAAK